MPRAEETASHQLHNFLQLREFTRPRLRMGTIEMHWRLGKTTCKFGKCISDQWIFENSKKYLKFQVFQPDLKICVIPGDVWTCDTRSTDPAIITKRYEVPESTDLADTSYLKHTPNPLEFSEMIDSSYVINDDAPELTIKATTAYPLIEFEKPHNEMLNSRKGVRNVSYHKEENYSFEYTHTDSWVPLPLIQEYKDVVNSHNKWLSELMNRLHIYKGLSTASLSVPIEETTTMSSTRTIAVFASHKRKQNVSLNHLVHDYVQLQNDKPSELEENDKPQTGNIAMMDRITTESTLQQLINGLDPDNNVIRVSDGVGNCRYLTIDAYKAADHQLIPRLVSIVSCTRNIRLPNQTDCGRYYMCNPRTAIVIDYSCPLHTAFNMNSRICDVESAKTCSKKFTASKIPVDRSPLTEHNINITRDEKLSEDKPCRELGKVKDPTSDFRYYICYSTSASEDVKSIRMTCPNALIFCQHKRVCTTKRLCDMS